MYVIGVLLNSALFAIRDLRYIHEKATTKNYRKNLTINLLLKILKNILFKVYKQKNNNQQKIIHCSDISIYYLRSFCNRHFILIII